TRRLGWLGHLVHRQRRSYDVALIRQRGAGRRVRFQRSRWAARCAWAWRQRHLHGPRASLSGLASGLAQKPADALVELAAHEREQALQLRAPEPQALAQQTVGL